MAHVAQLWRHPIKSHGREALDRVMLTAGQTMPWDRHWAVTHDATRFVPGAWAACQNFMTTTRTPGLAGIWAVLEQDSPTLTLHHQDLDSLRFAPDDPAGVTAFLTWIAPLCPDNRARPVGLVAVAGRGMTDTDYPSVSVMNTASHDAVCAVAGQSLDAERWRGNIWLAGLDAWDEHGWIGRTVSVGGVVLTVQERITRCLSTASNPYSGQRDVDTLGLLRNGWNHTDFGVYAQVVTGGTIHLGDGVRVN